jgi:hypothetical protein
MALLMRLEKGFGGLVDQGTCLNLQALFSIEGVLADPILMGTGTIGPEFDTGSESRIGNVVKA